VAPVITHAARAVLAPDALLQTHRTILIRGTIDDQVANQVIAKMLYLQHQAKSRLSIYIDSPGGLVTSSLAIRDAIDEMRAHVSTHCLGRAAGMALLVLAHGAPGARTASPVSQLELTPIVARDHELLDPAEQARIERLVVDMFAEDTGQPAEDIGRDMSAWRSFDTGDAQQYGFIDRVEG
jgi:ATP-dependent Clp protease protease subunit